MENEKFVTALIAKLEPRDFMYFCMMSSELFCLLYVLKLGSVIKYDAADIFAFLGICVYWFTLSLMATAYLGSRLGLMYNNPDALLQGEDRSRFAVAIASFSIFPVALPCYFLYSSKAQWWFDHLLYIQFLSVLLLHVLLALNAAYIFPKALRVLAGFLGSQDERDKKARVQKT